MTKIEACPSPVMVEVRSGAEHLVDPLRADRSVVGLRPLQPPGSGSAPQVVRAHQPAGRGVWRCGRPGEAPAAPRSCDRPSPWKGLAVERHADRLIQRLRPASVQPDQAVASEPGCSASAMSIQRRAALCPRTGPPAGCRRLGWWRARPGGSWSRPPPCEEGARPPDARSWSPAARWPWSGPDLGLEAANAASRPSAGRVFNGSASPAARKASRQALSSAAGTESSLDDSSNLAAQQPATPRSACAWPHAGGACQALAGRRQRRARAAGPAPRPSCPSCSPPRAPH